MTAGFYGSAQESGQNEPAVEQQVKYTCPMHPDVLEDEPGNCPICGMTLVETTAGQPGDMVMQSNDSISGMHNHMMNDSTGIED